jgi:hypothetical protein
MKHFFSYAVIILLASSLFAACSKSNNTPVVPTISQTFTINGSNYTADSVVAANGGAQVFAYNDYNGTQVSYGMVFSFHGIPQAGTYDIVDYNSAPGDGQVQIYGFDNIHFTDYLANAAPAAVKVSLTNGKYSIVMKTVTAKIQVNNQNPSGSANLSASFLEK